MSVLRTKPLYFAEILGLVLVLASAGWQVFLEDVARDIAVGCAHLRIEQKLWIVWHYMGYLDQEYWQHNPDRMRDDYYKLDKEFLELGTRESYVEQQVGTFASIRAWMFIAGSALVAIGRYAQISDRVKDWEIPRDPQLSESPAQSESGDRHETEC